jgi:hypothetical protein
MMLMLMLMLMMTTNGNKSRSNVKHMPIIADVPVLFLLVTIVVVTIIVLLAFLMLPSLLVRQLFLDSSKHKKKKTNGADGTKLTNSLPYGEWEKSVDDPRTENFLLWCKVYRLCSFSWRYFYL